MTVVNCLRNIGNNITTIDNSFPLRSCTLVLEKHVKHVNLFFKETHWTLVWGGRRWYMLYHTFDSQIINIKHSITWIIWLGKSGLQTWIVTDVGLHFNQWIQDFFQLFVTQQYSWHMVIEMKWGDLRWTISLCNIFTCFDHECQLNLVETSFLWNTV